MGPKHVGMELLIKKFKLRRSLGLPYCSPQRGIQQLRGHAGNLTGDAGLYLPDHDYLSPIFLGLLTKIVS